MKIRNSILIYIVAITILFGALSYVYAFIGPSQNPPGGNGILVASSTGALGIATTTVYSTESQMLFKTLGGSNQHIIFSPNGNVGIATTTPSQKLYVLGNIGASGSFIGTLSGSLSAANVSSEVFGRLQGEGNFAFPANLGVATSSEDGLPQSLSVYGGGYFSGDVGIGTVSPQSLLHIRGADPVLYIHDTESSSLDAVSYIKFSESDAGGNTEASFRVGLDSGGSGDRKLKIGFSSDDNNGAGSYSDLITVLDGGNVGIGTVNPGAKLEVNRETDSTQYTQGVSSLAVKSTGNMVDGFGANLGFSIGDTTQSLQIIAAISSVRDGADNQGKLTFAVRSGESFNPNSPQMVIDSSGNVGIGTDSPASTLTVGSNVAGVGLGGNTWIQVGMSGSNNVAGMYMGESSTDYLKIYWSADSSYGVISTPSNRDLIFQPDGGNVGIGTASPSSTLHIVGDLITTTYRSPIFDNGNAGSSITIDWDNGNIQYVTINALSVTINLTDGGSGGRYTLILKSGTSGSKTVTWQGEGAPENVSWGDSGTPMLSTGVGLVDYAGFVYNDIDSEYHGIAFNSGF